MFIKKMRSFTPLEMSIKRGDIMSKRNRTSKIEKWIKEGRGSALVKNSRRIFIRSLYLFKRNNNEQEA